MPSPNRVLVLAPGYGVAPVTTSESVTYNVNTEEITPEITSDHNKDQYGNPNQALHQKGLYAYKAEWQLASSSTLPPTLGATFTRTVENEASAVTFVVLKATIAKTTETKIRTTSIEAEQATGGAGNVSTSSLSNHVSDTTLDEHADALDSERKDRAVAMLGLPELIAGVQVEPLTPRRLEWLRAMGNPFVCGGDCPIAAIPDFIWYVTKDFAFGDDERRRAFLAAILDLDVDEAREGIDEYLDRAFLDAGPGREGVSFYGSTAGLYCSLNTAYPGAGWHLERVLDTPLRVLYQLIKAADDSRGCSMQNRRSSPLISKFLSEIEHFELSIVADFDAEMDAFVDAKCAEGYKLCSEPIQKINLAIPAACQQDAPWIVPMRKVS